MKLNLLKMKKIFFLAVIAMLGSMVQAQEKNGTVYIQHEMIDKTEAMWQAFVKGDKDGFGSFLAEDAVGIFNGDRKNHRKRDQLINGVSWWAEQFEDLEIVADTPAYADAIDYDNSGVWVQDWLLIKGVHKKTGIRLNLKEHHLYSFNEEGKISSIHFYFDTNVFREIRNSQRTRENGKVYINHPYIATVRKLINAYCNEDVEGMKKHYNENARFSDATQKWGNEMADLETVMNGWKNRFAQLEDINMEQIGYPDCIYYEQNDQYVVYSWWNHTSKSTETGDRIEFPIMLSHTFDNDGKIIRGMAYFSTNHFDE